MVVSARRRRSIYRPRLELLEGRLAPAVVTVTTTADDLTPNDGSVSLREAITAINAGNDLTDPDITNQLPGTFGINDAIHFNISSAGVQTIQVGITGNFGLPAITVPVTIDGSTEPGFAGTPLIVLDGTNAGFGSDGLFISGGGSTINDLAIINFRTSVVAPFTGGIGIEIQNNGGNQIFGNYIGVDSTGTTAAGNQGAGILINSPGGSSGPIANTIGFVTDGGSTIGNVISANQGSGIDLEGGLATILGNLIGVDASGTAALGNQGNGVLINAGGSNVINGNTISANRGDGVLLGLGSTNSLVQGNFIGTNSTGTAALGNVGNGVTIQSQSGNIIGVQTTGSGTIVGSPNIISGNSGDGILMTATTGDLVAGNFIGTDATGTQPLGNGRQGVEITGGAVGNTIGGTVTGTGNVIAFNQANGIEVGASIKDSDTNGNGLLSNSIFSNIGLGIDLGNDGVTINQPVGSIGPNNLQTFPILTSALESSGGITISGTFASVANTTFILQFFSSPTADPTGFGEGETLVGSVNVTTDASGNATFTTTFTPAPALGSAITATATSAASNDTSEFSQFIFAQAPTTTTIVSAPNPSVFGEQVTFTATVSPPSGGATPTGTVSFMEGATVLGTGMLDSTGTATFSTSALTAGMHDVTAAYSGDSQFATSSGTVTQTVNMANTTTMLTSAPNPSVFGQPVTFTATVTATPPGAGTPTGMVSFLEVTTPSGPAIIIGAGTLGSNGQATFTTSALSVGMHAISASYGGDTSFFGSDATTPVTQTVNQAATTTSLTAAPNPSDLGQSVLFTATVTPVAPGAGSPTGTVTFMEGSTVLGTSSLNSGSVATFNTFTLLAGTHTVIAVYAGDSSFTGSTSPAVSQTVNKGPTTTTIMSAPNPSVFGQAVVFTATVTTSVEGVATPTGTVSFIEGTTTLGTGTLDATGHATFTTSALTVGTHNVSAVYNGDSNFVTSTATAITQTVNKASTTTSLTSGANPSVFGQPVVFTATVAAVAPGAGTPTGTVTFMENSVVLGTATLGAGGQATFMTSTLTVGTHTIIASYGGDIHFLTSSSTSVSQVVNKASTTTTLLALPDPATAGQPIMFQSFVRVVAPGAGTPTGTVSFMEGATVLATASLNAGMATATIPSLTAGTHTLVAQYGGDASFAGSNSPTTVLVVNAAGSLQGAGVPVRAAEGRPLQNVVVANFTDTTGIQPASTYQATINWGDGTAATAGTVTRTGTTANETGGAFQVTGTHTYAAEGTFTVTITIARTGVAALTLTTTATVGGFVTQLYHDVLGRLPDAGGLSFWVSQLHQGLLTRTQVATSFWVSVEHRGLEVDQMYTTILHRPADAAGRVGWVNALLAGMPEGAVVIQFLTSVEYTASHPDNNSYVVGLYQDVLKRTATAQEIAGWVASLADGSLSRAQVAAMFLSSNEAFTQAIDDYYASFLGRAPDAVGFQSFLTQAQAGQLTPTTITAEFLGSDEYFNRALALAVQ